MKTFDQINGLKLTGPALARATLTWKLKGGISGGQALVVANNADGTSTLTLPTTHNALPRAVLNLTVYLTDDHGGGCCPRAMKVWADGCPPTSTIEPTQGSAGSELVPSCAPMVANP